MAAQAPADPSPTTTTSARAAQVSIWSVRRSRFVANPDGMSNSIIA
jgi:hypothetical protein